MKNIICRSFLVFLVVAMLVTTLTACNTQTQTNESSTTAQTETTTNSGTTPVIEQQGVGKVAALVKKMINEIYAQNFDYYVKSVTITGINVKRAENQIDYAPGVFADYQEPTDAIIDISYVAESVNKQTGEEKVVSNDISYTVNSEKALEVAEQGVDNMEIETVADAIVESTEEKIGAEEITGTNENDNIAGTQLSAKEMLAQAFNERFLSTYLEGDVYQNLINDGYELKTTLLGITDGVMYETNKDYIGCNISLFIDISVGSFSVLSSGTGYIGFAATKVITIASKDGQEEYIYRPAVVRFNLSEEQYNNIYNKINEFSGNTVSGLVSKIPKTVEEGQVYSDSQTICSSAAIPDEIYEEFINMVKNNSVIIAVPFPAEILDKNNLTNTQRLGYDLINVKNNPLVVVTNPTNELGK